MKKDFVLALLVMPIILLAQTDYDVCTRWYYNVQQWPDQKNYGYRLYEVIGDTLINNLTCNVVGHKLYHYSGQIEPRDNILLVSKDHQVFKLVDDSLSLVYDFKLDDGDTLYRKISNYQDCDSLSPLIIDSIQFVSHDGVQLKHQFCSQTLYFRPEWGYNPQNVSYELIERIGYKKQFMFAPSCEIGDSWGSRNDLRCYIDHELYYHDSLWQSYDCNDIITSIDDFSSCKIKVYPTITNSVVNLISDQFLYYHLYLSDINGSLLMTNDGCLPDCIDISFLKCGIYFITIESTDFNKTFRIMKQ